MSTSFRSFRNVRQLLQAVLPIRLNRMSINEKHVTDYSDVMKTPKIEKLLRREHKKLRSSERLRVQSGAIETLNFNEAALRKRVTRAVSKLVRRMVYSDESLNKHVAITDVRVPISLSEVLITWQPREAVQTLSNSTSEKHNSLQSRLKQKAQEIHNMLVGSTNGDNSFTLEDQDHVHVHVTAEDNQVANIRLDKLSKVSFLCHDPLERVLLMERTFETLKRMNTQTEQSQADRASEKDKGKLQMQLAIATDVAYRSSKVYELDRDILIREIEQERKRLAKSQWRSATSVTDHDHDHDPIGAAVVTDCQLDDAKRVRSALRNTTVLQSSNLRDTQRDASSVRNLISDADCVRRGDPRRQASEVNEDDLMGISDDVDDTEAELASDTKNEGCERVARQSSWPENCS